ncbi:endonuclease/exonuclease/phosphatase family protein [Pedobacter sp. BS3]|uniref:endonuclease/exonuclease/phosphatase family protein n=1 Tax=Pedobacter sp. BS3 TaxID=2567937 RepID=UPI0011F018DF|nr:endonuclease/exonuclease/phosphatase family protein [Pedobacter sp. BS3]TZF82235.1 endonuclease/exonuclease/phosphatase family protein [Pedobacter sp. BS3]
MNAIRKFIQYPMVIGYCIIVCISLLVTSCGKKTEVKDQEPVSKKEDTGNSDSIAVTILVKDNQGQKIGNVDLTVSGVNNLNRIFRIREATIDGSGEISLKIAKDLTANGAKFDFIEKDHEPISYQLTNIPAKLEVYMNPVSTLSIFSYNTLEGFQNNADRKKAFAEWIKKYNPDIIFFQELNKFTENTLNTFAKTYGHNNSVLLKTTGYPTGITSKYAIENADRVTSAPFVHGYIYAKVKGINLFAIHLSPKTLDERKAEIAALITRIKTIPANEKIIVAGDFNSYNELDKNLYGKDITLNYKKYNPNTIIDYTVTNSMLNNSFLDVYGIKHHEFKATLPVMNNKYDDENYNQGWRYDYIFTRGWTSFDIKYSDILQKAFTDEASDHYPVYVRLAN